MLLTEVPQDIAVWAIALGLPALVTIFYFKGAFIAKPIPTSILLPGYLLATDHSTSFMAVIVLLCTTAAVIGEATVYQGVKRQDLDFFNRIPKVSVTESQLDVVGKRFEKYGWISLLVGSAIPGVRGLIMIPAALSAYPSSKAVAASFIGTGFYYTLIVCVALGIVSVL